MALSMYSSMAFVSLVDGGKFGCDEVWLQLINQYYCHRGDWGKGGGVLDLVLMNTSLYSWHSGGISTWAVVLGILMEVEATWRGEETVSMILCRAARDSMLLP